MSSTELRDAARALDPGAVLVAVDGSADADRAIAWAAQQAYLERRPLVVVTTRDAVVADEAVGVAQRLHPGLEVTELVIGGDPRFVLTELSRHAHLLVLGSRGRGMVGSRLLGSVSAAVSRDAACPVFVCRPLSPEASRRGILLGVDGTEESLPVVELAFHQASLTDLPLTVVHCFWDPDRLTHEPEVVAPDEPGLGEHRLLLAESVAGMASKFPEVQVALRLQRGIVEECLVAGSADWDLVVVGRHPVDTLPRYLTGAVATIVVERARTTVAVVPVAWRDPDHS
ncbi:MAG TPA: universal stress protein [Nocardioides sp.]|nr:universal stress protein [Nocardioides sp.]